MTKSLVYNGPHPEVVVDELNDEQVIVAGQPVDIPDALAARLLEQDTWAPNESPEQKKAREKQEQDDAAAAKAQAEADAAKAAQGAPTPDAAPVDPATDTTTKGDS